MLQIQLSIQFITSNFNKVLLFANGQNLYPSAHGCLLKPQSFLGNDAFAPAKKDSYMMEDDLKLLSCFQKHRGKQISASE